MATFVREANHQHFSLDSGVFSVDCFQKKKSACVIKFNHNQCTAVQKRDLFGGRTDWVINNCFNWVPTWENSHYVPLKEARYVAIDFWDRKNSSRPGEWTSSFVWDLVNIKPKDVTLYTHMTSHDGEVPNTMTRNYRKFFEMRTDRYKVALDCEQEFFATSNNYELGETRCAVRVWTKGYFAWQAE
jgi:hypothetical protein